MEEVDLHTCEPWQLPDSAKLGANEWYFFSFRDRKYSTGSRTNRATTYGYWKATGRDRPVFDSSARVIVGMRKTLVYYLERAPNGVRTNWIMHEFRVEDSSTPSKEDWVLCRVFHKRKAEYTTLPQDHEYEGIVASSSPNIDIPAGLNQVNTICNISHEEDNPIDIESSHIPKHPHSNPSIAVNGDEFGFLLDMNLEDHNMKGELLSLDEMGF